MFIATSARPRSRSVRSETRQRNLHRDSQKRLRTYGASDQRADCHARNISPLWGEATNNDLLHFQLEFALINMLVPAFEQQHDFFFRVQGDAG